MKNESATGLTLAYVTVIAFLTMASNSYAAFVGFDAFTVDTIESFEGIGGRPLRLS